MCLVPPGDAVGGELQRRTTQHRNEINSLLPAARLEALSEVGRVVSEMHAPASLYVDVSAMPRGAICDALSAIAAKAAGETRIFIIHADPESYHHGALQSPDPGLAPVFKDALPERHTKVRALMFPGFDLPYALVALTYITALTGEQPSVKWFFSFPGRKYLFYQRARETHAHLIGTSQVGLYPQHQITLSFERLKPELSSSEPTLVVPLGPRITCVSIFLATLWARARDNRVDILLPRTSKYTSLRSTGYVEPMIEEISAVLGSMGESS